MNDRHRLKPHPVSNINITICRYKNETTKRVNCNDILSHGVKTLSSFIAYIHSLPQLTNHEGRAHQVVYIYGLSSIYYYRQADPQKEVCTAMVEMEVFLVI